MNGLSQLHYGNDEVSGEHYAGLLSRFTFHWVFPLMSVSLTCWISQLYIGILIFFFLANREYQAGYQKPLKKTDIWRLNPDRSVTKHRDDIVREFRRRTNRHERWPLLWALHSTFKLEFWIGGIAMLFANLLQVIAPLLVKILLEAIASGGKTDRGDFHKALFAVVAMFLSQMGMSFGLIHYQYLGQVIGGEVKAALTSLIFEKSLKLSDGARHRNNNGLEDRWSDGQVSNLISNDTQRIESALMYANMIWSEPLAVIVSLVILFMNLGYHAIFGLALLVVGAKALDRSMGLMSSKRSAINFELDNRATTTQEVLQNIRFVKYQAWEGVFEDKIASTRASEVRIQCSLLNIRNIIGSLSSSLPSFAAMVSFITLAFSSRDFSAAEVFSSLALFNCLRKPLNILPHVVSQLIDAWLSLGRIEEFLLADEHVNYVELDFEAPHVMQVEHADFLLGPNCALGTNTASMSFSANESQQDLLDARLLVDSDALELHEPAKLGNLVLQDVTFHLSSGELVAVVGDVGSGKSSLLSALNGDISLARGKVIGGSTRVSCPQNPWIMSGSLKDNITFGKPFRQSWYEQVVDACALQQDVDAFVDGHETQIGERGITLSGGQKQRLSLARGIYSESELILLDDPLSAVDVHVGKHIFEKAICGLLAKTCRVIATHQLQSLHHYDRIIWLEGGKVQALDTLDNLLRAENGFADFFHNANGQNMHSDSGKNNPGNSEFSKLNLDHSQKEFEEAFKDEELTDEKENVTAQIEQEIQESGSVTWHVYKSYFVASGKMSGWPVVFVLLFSAQACGIFTGIWLSWWVEDILATRKTTYAVVYAGLVTVQSAAMFCFLHKASNVGLEASSSLFLRALSSVLHAPMPFHIANPVGRLMNLFSNDLSNLDNGVSGMVRGFFMLIGVLVSTLALICTYFTTFAYCLPFLVAAIYATARYFRASQRELKRHEITYRSVVNAKASEAVSGRETIRSYMCQQDFIFRLNENIDSASSISYLISANQQWINLRLELVGNLMVLLTGLLIITSNHGIPDGVSGLILTYILAVVQIVPGIITQTAEVENSMIAVERMEYYGNSIPSELSAPKTIQPKISWPVSGGIVFRGVSVRYKYNLPMVLQDISLDIKGGEKIGVVGRTGAGKSTLLSTLFRLIDYNGAINIDDIDISKLSLFDLRSKLAIIPQEASLFHGTVRSNLDPSAEHTDQFLWEALEKTGLRSRGVGIPNVHLDQEVLSEGSNFSSGEKQLLALCRALVRNSQILVCDEATSAMDYKTDRLVQQIIRDIFHDKTVICIAHKIRTIIDYDRVCLLENGKLVAFDRPATLFIENQLFRDMCDESNLSRLDFISQKHL